MELNTRNQVSPIALPREPEQTPAEEKKLDAYGWITSEGLLRDEGALYGIAAADITDKLNAVISFYDAKRAVPLQAKTFLEEKITALKGMISSQEEELSSLKKTLVDTRRESQLAQHFFPVTFQFLAILAVCIFNFFLVRYWLTPVISSDIICIAIYLLGLFSVYLGRGIIDNLGSKTPEDAETPVVESKKQLYIKEFAVSAIVALFICTLTFRAYPVEHTAVAFFVMFVLFLSGKVFVNMFFKWREESVRFFNSLISKRRIRRDIRRITRQHEDAEASLLEARKELQEPEILLKKYAAEQDYKTHIFLSEYNLALHSSHPHNISLAKQFA